MRKSVRTGDEWRYKRHTVASTLQTWTSEGYGQKNQGAIGNIDDARQVYQLYPNPNNGNIVLTQYILDTEPIQIEVYNAMGCKISNIPLQFNSYTQYVKLSSITPPGLYLLHIINSKNHSFILKFVKE